VHVEPEVLPCFVLQPLSLLDQQLDTLQADLDILHSVCISILQARATEIDSTPEVRCVGGTIAYMYLDHEGVMGVQPLANQRKQSLGNRLRSERSTCSMILEYGLLSQGYLNDTVPRGGHCVYLQITALKGT
jgi:hypothetical protein